MASEHRRKENMIILFVVGGLALNYPLLSIFDRLLLSLGIPLLYLYVFLVWLIIILLMALIAEKSWPRGDDRGEP